MNPEEGFSLAIDQGTFSSRAMLLDTHGSICCSSQKPLTLNKLDNNHIEQDGESILQSVQQVVEQVLSESATNHRPVLGCGIATQRSSVLAWSPQNGEVLSPVLSWQDTRAADWLKQFYDQSGFIQQRTGLRLSAHYGVSKIHWLIKNQPGLARAVAQQQCVITPIASFLLYHLSDDQNIQVDIANASRSLLLNLARQQYDEALIQLFNIPRSVLPECRPTQFDYGKLRHHQIPIRCVNGDQTAALYSQGQPPRRHLRINLGTGAFVLMPATLSQIQSAGFIKSQLLAGISTNHKDSAQYFIEGTVNGAGAAIEWLAGQYPSQNLSDRIRKLGWKSELNTFFINSVGGIGSPFWRSNVNPAFIEDDENLDDRLQAVLESMVFLLQVNIDHLLLLQKDLEKIDISGGLAEIPGLCQRIANLSGLAVIKTENSEATARGIAWLASVNTSDWLPQPIAQRYSPIKDQALERRYRTFLKLLSAHLDMS